MNTVINVDVGKVFHLYPNQVQKKMFRLRKIIFEVAEKSKAIEQIEETLKWGEPSYITNIGSTVRIDWKEKQPNQYGIYFKCTSKLVPTFREIYGKQFNFEKNRAIIFDLKDKIPVKELKECILMALTYHKVKHLPRLGA